jgi:hypothetical protein
MTLTWYNTGWYVKNRQEILQPTVECQMLYCKLSTILQDDRYRDRCTLLLL